MASNVGQSVAPERDLQSTPRMDEADREHASALSLRHLRPPKKVPGYEQEEFLGRGAFGEVWKAVDSNSGRQVAIKFYSRRGGLDWSHMAREVEKLQHLFSDRYVVQLFDVGWESDPPYYVMEYMDAGSLEDRLQQGPMPLAEALPMIREITRGLVHAHDKGILHCDLKPANIMLDQDGRPRLADFGQARLRNERVPALGTLFYMAPEQASLAAMPDARWDVYALGAIMYRMITGQLPYMSDQIATSVSSHGAVEERLRSYSDLLQHAPHPTAHRHGFGVDKPLAQIIERCLAVDPKRRYHNAQSVLSALEARQLRRAQRPLLVLGLFGPLLVLMIMGLASGYLFRQTVTTAERELLERTDEGNGFAAESVADRFGLEVDRRWRILNQEAADIRIRAPLSIKSDPATTTSEDAAMADFIDRRRNYWNSQLPQASGASYWFVLDRQGRLRAISPAQDGLLGKYYGFREYFHGQGTELKPDAPPPTPIAAPHRSNVFRSQPDNVPAVAFSVPIFSDQGEDPDVVGVLAMEAELGHFAEFSGSRNQFAALIDMRPDQNGLRGLVVEHPSFAEQLARKEPLGEHHVDGDTLARLEQIATAQREPTPAANGAAVVDRIDFYHDPVGGAYSGDWLAAAAPVMAPSAGNATVDTGWAVLVQERRADTLGPLNRVRATIFYGALAALILVALLVAGLWGMVLTAINATRRKFTVGGRVRGGASTTTGTASGGSAHSS